ncbi:MAG: hypothetical protein M5T61_00775 [Acidimicrobiia bacterium]|nr:hypothetical protein [Acidimicrobiia bacterium]
MTPGAASDCASLAATAAGDATAAAVRSRVAIAETQDIPVIEAACALLTRIWGTPRAPGDRRAHG